MQLQTDHEEGQSSAAVAKMRFNDCDEFSSHFRKVNYGLLQLSPGGFEASLTRAEIPSAVIYHSTFTNTTLGSAVSQDNQVWMLHPQHWDSELTYNGQTVEEGDVIFYGPGGVHSTKGKDKDVVAVAFDRAVVERTLASLTQTGPPAMDGLSAVLRLPPSLARQTKNIMQTLTATLANEPENFDNPAASRALSHCLQTLLLNTLEAAVPARTMRSARSSVSQSKVLRRAAAFLKANAGSNIYVSDLCEATGVSIRSLEHIFRSHFGMPAMRYLKLQRLHLARKMLSDPLSAVDSVKSASLSCGFWELGRFAGEYRQLFGELPSVTLARRGGRWARAVEIA